MVTNDFIFLNVLIPRSFCFGIISHARYNLLLAMIDMETFGILPRMCQEFRSDFAKLANQSTLIVHL